MLYGDTRPVHAQAVARANTLGLRVHVFEEGYMRLFWVAHERGGSNGNSRLMNTTVSEKQTTLERSDMEAPMPQNHWGDMRQHVFCGALYHWFVIFRNGQYRHFRTHRNIPVIKEFGLYVKRLLLMPMQGIKRHIATWRIRNGGFPFHLALLQLELDSSFQMHSHFDTIPDFLELVIRDFAKGAPQHHHLVFKAHPLVDGRVPVRKYLKEMAAQFGVSDRVHYVRGAKLARLLNDARTAITMNSTAGQQVLWRGIPLKIFGSAVYSKPEFISYQPLVQFFKAAERPNKRAYKYYRR